MYSSFCSNANYHPKSAYFYSGSVHSATLRIPTARYFTPGVPHTQVALARLRILSQCELATHDYL